MYRVGSVWGFRLRIDTSPFGPVFAAQAGRGKKENAYIILYFEFVIISILLFKGLHLFGPNFFCSKIPLHP